MVWAGRFFAFNLQTIESSAPSAAGIYVLRRRGHLQSHWVQVGAAEDLRAQLTALAKGGDERISKQLPTDFGFEVIRSAAQRETRRRVLIGNLAPICP